MFAASAVHNVCVNITALFSAKMETITASFQGINSCFLKYAGSEFWGDKVRRHLHNYPKSPF